MGFRSWRGIVSLKKRRAWVTEKVTPRLRRRRQCAHGALSGGCQAATAVQGGSPVVNRGKNAKRGPLCDVRSGGTVGSASSMEVGKKASSRRGGGKPYDAACSYITCKIL